MYRFAFRMIQTGSPLYKLSESSAQEILISYITMGIYPKFP